MIQFQTSPLKYRSYIEVCLPASGWPEKVIYMGQLFHTGPKKDALLSWAHCECQASCIFH